jgi:hypothetical protein
MPASTGTGLPWFLQIPQMAAVAVSTDSGIGRLGRLWYVVVDTPMRKSRHRLHYSVAGIRSTAVGFPRGYHEVEVLKPRLRPRHEAVAFGKVGLGGERIAAHTFEPMSGYDCGRSRRSDRCSSPEAH